MNYTPIGRVRPIHRGAHDPSAAYAALDVVRREDGFASYMARRDVPAGTPLADGEYWGLLSDGGLKAVADASCPAFEECGGAAVCHPVSGYPLEVKTLIAPKQSGSGEPSPDNIRPISGWTGAELTRCGKNLMDLSKAYGYGVWRSLVVPAGTPITFSVYSTAGLGQFNGEIMYEDGTKTAFILIAPNSENNVWHTYSITPEKQIKYYCMYDIEQSNKRTITKGMIVFGSASDYEPYAGDTYTADFGQTVYGGTLDWNAGVLTVEWAMMTLGQDNEISTNREYIQKTNTVQMSVVCQNAIPHTEYIISSAFPSARYNWDEDVVSIAVMYDYRIDIAMPKSILTQYGFDNVSDYIKDVTAFKAWLADMTAAGTPVQVCYRLATPTTIQLSPVQIAALAGTNTLYTDCGDTRAAGRSDMTWVTQGILDRLAALEAAAVSE